MRLVYLITAYNNPLHLKALINALDNKEVDFFIHIDKKSKINFDIPKKKNIYVLQDSINVYWGGFSFISAVLKLLQKAKGTAKYDYYVLISGTDYPVRSNTYIKDFLKKNNGKEFINLSPMPENDKHLDRVEYFYLETELNLTPTSFLKRVINRTIRILNLKRSLPHSHKDMVFYGGSNWWAFSSDMVEYILDFVNKNKKFVNYFKHTLIPEESFFHTIIGNSPFKKNVINSFVYTEWIEGHTGHPEEISEKHLELFKTNEVNSQYGNKKATSLFARKFSDKNMHLLKIIDKKYRQ